MSSIDTSTVIYPTKHHTPRDDPARARRASPQLSKRRASRAAPGDVRHRDVVASRARLGSERALAVFSARRRARRIVAREHVDATRGR